MTELKVLSTDKVVDDLTTTSTEKPLSANQGKVLKDLVDTKQDISNIVTSFSASPSNSKYPSERLVYGTIAQLSDIMAIGTTDWTETSVKYCPSVKTTKDALDLKASTTHATTHYKDGTDQIAIDGTQVTTGTIANSRLPIATTSGVGVVKPDGSTVTIDANGRLSATGMAAVNWGDINGTLSNQTDLNTALAGKEPTITTKNTAFNKNFGTASGTVCEGNDTRLSDTRNPKPHATTHGNTGTDRIVIDSSQITTGVIDVDRIPHSAFQKMVTVANQAARLALTTSDVNTGDTVLQQDTNVMYFVKDETQLGTEAAFQVYTATTSWSTITGKPSTFTPSAHASTHATGGTDAITPADIGAASQFNFNAHLSNLANPHGVTKSQVGLGNVDNVAVSNMAFSGSQITSGTVSEDRLPIASSSTRGTVKQGTGVTIASDGTISTISTSPAWGNIVGTLSNQTDLNNALNTKQTISNMIDDWDDSADDKYPNATLIENTLLDYQLIDNCVDSWQSPFLPDEYPNATLVLTTFNTKVDKIDGMGLTSNDFTNTLKSKLDNIEGGAQVNVIETVKVNGTALTPTSKAVNVTVPTALSSLTDDSTHRLVTDTEKTTWNGKQNAITSSNKLLSDLVDTTSQTNLFVTSTEKSTWNGKQEALVSGTNIKTINSTSLLGSGNIAVQPKYTTATATLTVAGWSSKSQTVSVTGVTASNLVIISPDGASYINYGKAGVHCTTQSAGSLTFACEDVPTTALTINVAIFN